MRRDQLYAGLLAPVIALTGIGVAISINRSWWSLTENAISDLGKVGLPNNWVLNTSLVLASILGIYYALGLFRDVKNPVERAGIGLFTLGLVFLAMIGLFPEGTSPHYYVSWAFFILASSGFLVAGIGMGFKGEKKMALFTASLFLTGWILAIWAKRKFEGVATAEFIGIFGILLWHYVVLWTRFREAPRPRG